MTFNDAIKKMLEKDEDGHSELDLLVNNNANRLKAKKKGNNVRYWTRHSIKEQKDILHDRDILKHRSNEENDYPILLTLSALKSVYVLRTILWFMNEGAADE